MRKWTTEEIASDLTTPIEVVEALFYGRQAKDIEDDDLAHAWEFLQRQWDRFEVELRAWDAILKSKVKAGTSSV